MCDCLKPRITAHHSSQAGGKRTWAMLESTRFRTVTSSPVLEWAELGKTWGKIEEIVDALQKWGVECSEREVFPCSWTNKGRGADIAQPCRSAPGQQKNGQFGQKQHQQQQLRPRHAKYWAPLTQKRHSAHPSANKQPQNKGETDQQPVRPTGSENPTHCAKGRTGDCPGPRKETNIGRNVTQWGRGGCVAAAVKASHAKRQKIGGTGECAGVWGY